MDTATTSTYNLIVHHQSDELEPALSTLLAEQNIGIILTDTSLNIIHISATARRWLSSELHQTQGRALVSLLPALGASEPELYALLQGYTERFELMRVTTTATVASPPRLLAFARRDATGTPLGLLIALCEHGERQYEGLIRQLRQDLFHSRQQAAQEHRRAHWQGLAFQALLDSTTSKTSVINETLGALALSGMPVIRSDLAFVGQITDRLLQIEWWPHGGQNTPSVRIPARPDGLLSALEAGLLPHISNNIMHDSLIDPELKADLGPGSVILFPLLSTDAYPLGLLGWHCPEVRRIFSPDERAVMEAIASQAAILLDRHLLRTQLNHQLAHDALTGLPNSTQLYPKLGRILEYAHHQEQQVSMVVMSIDELRQINDQYGLQAGDDLLRALSGAVKSRLRQRDIAFRSSAAELALVLPGASSTGAQTLSQALYRAFSVLEVVPGVHPSISMGIATFPTHGKDAESLLEAARGALVRAREIGPGSACVAR